jgi:PPOX class probable F420-dependent enzyme
MALDPAALPDAALEFLRERHLATLTTLRPDGSPHVVAVGFTWDVDDRLVRVITSGSSVKAANAARGGRAAVCQVDGRRWLTLEGAARVLTVPDEVRDAEARYALRYRQPRPNPQRVVVILDVDRALGSV